MTQQTANRLANETSPYLLQHAHNPVDWFPWGDEAFQKAKEEDKPLIISIGYSSCHWCHVMEDESFEDSEVAELMNQYFVPVKVDREERPDVDQLYMDAVSLMTGHGGWPLNAFIIPDGRPIFGGTYFPKENWMQICNEISKVYNNDRQKVIDYADKLEQGIKNINVIEVPSQKDAVQPEDLDQVFQVMQQGFDEKYGGRRSAPKFPLPDNSLFLLRYYVRSKDQQASDQVKRTLENMAHGGIYDQLGGGFARYSTDQFWKVPHFEKMLYDNGQLVSLFAEGYQLFQKETYRKVVYETIDYIEREMTSDEGGFFSALDADSEGEEGKFYTWHSDDFKNALDDELAPLMLDYYGIDKEASWEGGKNVLVVARSVQDLAIKHQLTENQVREKLEQGKAQLFEARSHRVRPGLDDKILLAWNALVLKGLLDAYKVFQKDHFLTLAQQNMDFLQDKLIEGDQLYRSYKNGIHKIEGFLDDYASFIQALIKYYEVTFDEEKLYQAKQLTEKVMNTFFDEISGMFFYKPASEVPIITHKIDFSDNVIASPNSVMANNLFLIGHYFDEDQYIEQAHQMLSTVWKNLEQQPTFFSNWGMLATYMIEPFFEVAITGPDAVKKRLAIERLYQPHKLMAGSENGASQLDLLKNRYQEGKNTIYVCVNKSCNLPTENVDEAIEQLKL